MRAVLAGGGTGGHVIPALAIAHELKSRFAAEVLFIGTARGIETRLVPAAGYPLNLIEIGALKSVGLATRIRTLFKLPGSILQSRQFLREFQADVVISVGGYASGPTMVGAAMSKIPVLIFEPNLVPGFANRMGARFATAAATQFQATCRYFRNCTVTGIPVRKAFFDVPKRAPHSNPTVLVFGGSQGARAINRAVTGALSLLKEKIPGLTLIHQTGEREFEEIQKAYSQSGFPGTVSRFIDDMPGAFAQSDLLICRSGASTVAEVAAAGKPAIFIPLPTAADDHQTRNAEALVAAGAAALLKQADLTPDSLVEKIQNLLQNPAGLATMSEAAQKLAYRNAAEEVAKLAVNLSQQRVKK